VQEHPQQDRDAELQREIEKRHRRERLHSFAEQHRRSEQRMWIAFWITGLLGAGIGVVQAVLWWMGIE